VASLRNRAGRASLLVRFAVVSLVLVVVLGVAMAQLLASMIAARGLESAKDAAVLTTAIAVQPLLSADDLADGLSPAKVASLDRAVRGSRGGTEIARIKIWHGDGDLVYVADPHTRSPARTGADPSSELAEALEGNIEAEIISSADEPDNAALIERYGTLLEVYVPILSGDDPEPAGVFELYLPYQPVQASIRADTTRAVALLFAGLIVLWLGLFRTVATASRRLRQEAARNEHQALHDGLTGLANREQLDAELSAAVASPARSVALVLLDLDRFREVNDTLGHARGDELVLEMAARLSALAGPDDLVARLGGDEFAVLLRDVDGLDSAMVHAEVMRGALREPVQVGGLDVALDARAGVSVHPSDAADGPALLRHADVAAEHAKRTHAGVCAYDADLDEHSTERLGLLADLARALTAGELVLHYQPKCDLDGRVLGVEALVRWQHPQRGLLPPMTFVPVAERTGLVHPLTNQVLDLALAQARQWLGEGRSLPVAVNVSTRSLLQPGFAEKVLTALGTHGVPAALLALEITETTIMEDPERALEVLTRLAAAGVRLSIDDFGTGYSSLAYLKNLPVHELKIDRTFVAALTSSERDRVIVDSTVALGNRLGLDVVAEGVEDEETVAALAALGCRLAQGFLFSRPVPADQLVLPDPVSVSGAQPEGSDRVV
jgi:diguanylate cyclase (GGDEF)-like protein